MYTFSNIDTQLIWEKEIDIIHEIEQDSWARAFWELIQCNCCNSILSKDDVFWHLSEKVQLKTVKQINNILGGCHIICTKCWSNNTEYMYGEEYKKSIKERYSNPKSYLTFANTEEGETIGFMDWYISDFHNIYENEFEFYYNELWEETLKVIIESKMQAQLPDEFLSLTSVCLKWSHCSLFIIFQLLKSFYKQLESINPHTQWIAELDPNGSLYKLYKLLGCYPLNLNDTPEYKNKIKNKNWDSDIYIFPKSSEEYSYILSQVWLKNLLKESKKS